ncbi:hypothetical protein PMAYCL1PPCAC_32703, partial [Pristionchus mayeri]
RCRSKSSSSFFFLRSSLSMLRNTSSRPATKSAREPKRNSMHAAELMGTSELRQASVQSSRKPSARNYSRNDASMVKWFHLIVPQY